MAVDNFILAIKGHVIINLSSRAIIILWMHRIQNGIKLSACLHKCYFRLNPKNCLIFHNYMAADNFTVATLQKVIQLSRFPAGR